MNNWFLSLELAKFLIVNSIAHSINYLLVMRLRQITVRIHIDRNDLFLFYTSLLSLYLFFSSYFALIIGIIETL